MTTQTTNSNDKRTKCLIYTRVMGYLRPVQAYNHWKKSEFYSRTYFDAKKSMKEKFEEKYWNKENILKKEIYEPMTMTVGCC